MRTLLFLALTALVIPTSVPSRNAPELVRCYPQETGSLAGNWVLMNGPLSACTIRFNLGSNTFTGNTGCNDFTGTFYKSADTLRIDKQILTLTKNSCTQDEAAFLRSFLLTNHYQVINGMLVLLNGDSAIYTWNRPK